mmetsp:Transcript_26960/g.58921  ORF Transcript_26960/g.58921 Transcript_26960/m.58921 type:complete len:358 (-) Transcript_26960:1000-2073(-)
MPDEGRHALKQVVAEAGVLGVLAHLHQHLGQSLQADGGHGRNGGPNKPNDPHHCLHQVLIFGALGQLEAGKQLLKQWLQECVQVHRVEAQLAVVLEAQHALNGCGGIRVHHVVLGAHEGDEGGEDAHARLLGQQRPERDDELDGVRLEDGRLVDARRLQLRQHLCCKEVVDVDQLVGLGGTQGTCLSPDGERQHQVDGAVLGLPVLYGVSRVLRQHGLHVSGEQLRDLLGELLGEGLDEVGSSAAPRVAVTALRVTPDVLQGVHLKHLLVLGAYSQVGHYNLLADLLQSPGILEERVVHTLADSGEEPDGVHHQVVLSRLERDLHEQAPDVGHKGLQVLGKLLLVHLHEQVHVLAHC